MSLSAPALLVHVLFPAYGPDADEAWREAGVLWRRAVAELGLSLPVPALAVDAVLPAAPSGDGRVLIAAAQSAAGGVWQALAWAAPDVIGVTLMAAPAKGADGCGPVWSDLERRLDPICDAGHALGQIRLLLCLYPAEEPAETVSALVRAGHPGPAAIGWWRPGRHDAVPLTVAPGDGLLVWEAGPNDADARALRRLVVAVPEPLESAADGFLWTNGDGRPAPFTRYLVHAAKLRHQLRVFADGSAARAARARLDEALGDLAGDEPRALARIEREVSTASLVRSRLERLARIVDAVREDMRESFPRGTSGSGPLHGDLDLAEWFSERVRDETAALDEMSGRAGAIVDLWRPRPGAARAVLVTASQSVYLALRRSLTGPFEEREERGTLYEIGSLGPAGAAWRLALVHAGHGTETAGLEIDRAIGVFAPDVVLFVGLAGGRRKVRVGDVVVASAIYDYTTGADHETGFRPHFKTHHPSSRMLQWSRRVIRRYEPADSTGGSPVQRPRFHIGPAATGGHLVADGRSSTARLLDSHTDDALAVDTEGYGFLHGAYLNPHVDTLVIQEISTLVGDTTSPPAEPGAGMPADEACETAGLNAAAFAIDLISALSSGTP